MRNAELGSKQTRFCNLGFDGQNIKGVEVLFFFIIFFLFWETECEDLKGRTESLFGLQHSLIPFGVMVG